MHSFLVLRSWHMDLVGLELHVLTSSPKNYHSCIKELLDLLFRITDRSDLDVESDLEAPFNDISQSRIGLPFVWFDSLSASLEPIQFQSTPVSTCSCVFS